MENDRKETDQDHLIMKAVIHVGEPSRLMQLAQLKLIDILRSQKRTRLIMRIRLQTSIEL